MQDVVKQIDDLSMELKDLKSEHFSSMNISEEKNFEISSENRSAFTSDSPVMASCRSVNEIVMKFVEFIYSKEKSCFFLQYLYYCL